MSVKLCWGIECGSSELASNCTNLGCCDSRSVLCRENNCLDEVFCCCEILVVKQEVFPYLLPLWQRETLPKNKDTTNLLDQLLFVI